MAITKFFSREKVWQIIIILVNLNILWVFFWGGYYDYMARWDVFALGFRNLILTLVSFGAVLVIIKSLYNIFIKK